MPSGLFLEAVQYHARTELERAASIQPEALYCFIARFI